MLQITRDAAKLLTAFARDKDTGCLHDSESPGLHTVTRKWAQVSAAEIARKAHDGCAWMPSNRPNSAALHIIDVLLLNAVRQHLALWSYICWLCCRYTSAESHGCRGQSC